MMLLLIYPGSENSFQEKPIDRIIRLEPGIYSAPQLLKKITQSGVDVNYSQAALLHHTITITKIENKLVDILPLIFDFSKYKYAIKNDKILIIRISTNS